MAEYFEDGACRPLLDASTVVPTSTSSTSGVNKDASGSCLGSEGSAPHAVRVASGLLLTARFCCSSKQFDVPHPIMAQVDGDLDNSPLHIWRACQASGVPGSPSTEQRLCANFGQRVAAQSAVVVRVYAPDS